MSFPDESQMPRGWLLMRDKNPNWRGMWKNIFIQRHSHDISIRFLTLFDLQWYVVEPPNTEDKSYRGKETLSISDNRLLIKLSLWVVDIPLIILTIMSFPWFRAQFSYRLPSQLPTATHAAKSLLDEIKKSAEEWFVLSKQFSAAFKAEISRISGLFLFRPFAQTSQLLLPLPRCGCCSFTVIRLLLEIIPPLLFYSVNWFHPPTFYGFGLSSSWHRLRWGVVAPQLNQPPTDPFFANIIPLI